MNNESEVEMFTKTNARKTIFPYMAKNWEEFEIVFFQNLEKEANGKSAKWLVTPSRDAEESWNRILKRNGIIK